MGDVPDFYADNFSINISLLGATLTFVRSTPAVQDVSEASQEIVSRVRLSREGVKALADFLTSALAQAQGPQGPQSGDGKKN